MGKESAERAKKPVEISRVTRTYRMDRMLEDYRNGKREELSAAELAMLSSTYRKQDVESGDVDADLQSNGPFWPIELRKASYPSYYPAWREQDSRVIGVDYVEDVSGGRIAENGQYGVFNDFTNRHERAKDAGFLDRFFALFHSKIDFHAKGTRISGKNKSQVRGGKMLLFPGGVLDLVPAQMKGIKGKGYQGAEGSKAYFIYKNSHRIKEIEIEKFKIVKEDTSDEVRLQGKAARNQMIESPASDDLKISPDTGILTEQGFFVDPGMDRQGRPHAVVIGKSGLTEDYSRYQSITETGDDDQQEIKTTDTENEGGGSAIARKPTAKIPIHTNAPEEKATESEAESKPEESVADPENSRKEQSAEEKTENPKISGTGYDMIHRSSETDEASEKEEEEKEEETSKNPVERFKNYIKEQKEKATEFKDKAVFAKQALFEYFKTGEMPENRFKKDGEDEEEEKGLEFKLFEYPLLPGLNFEVTLEPSYLFRMGLAPLAESPLNHATASGKDIRIGVRGYVDASLGLALNLALSAGLEYLLEMEGGLEVSAALHGGLERVTKENEALENRLIETDVFINVHENEDGTYSIGNMLNLHGEAALEASASVGCNLSISSKLFDFDQDLFEYEFGSWSLARLEGSMDATGNLSPEGISDVKIRQTSFSGQTIWDKIKHAYRLGFDVEREQADIDTQAISKGSITQADILLERIEKAREKADAETGGSGSEEMTPARQELKLLYEELSGVEAELNQRLLQISDRRSALSQNKTYVKNKEKLLRIKEKHEQALSALRDVQGSTDEGEAKKRYLKEHSRILDVRDEKLMDQAARDVGSIQKLIAYEEGRKKERAKENRRKKDTLKNYISEHQLNEAVFDQGFYDQYNSLYNRVARTNAGRMLKSKDVLKQYEQSKYDLNTKSHRERKAALEAKITELDIQDPNQYSKELLAFYEKELGAKNFFSSVEWHHQSIPDLLEYEWTQIKAKHSERLNHINLTIRAIGFMDESKQGEIEKNEVQKYFQDFNASRMKKKYWMTASKETIIRAEEKRQNEIRSETEKKWEGKAQDRAKTEAAARVNAVEKGSKEEKQKAAITIGEIIEYERVRIEHYSKHNDVEGELKHRIRYEFLLKRQEEIRKKQLDTALATEEQKKTLQDAVDALINETKDQYFNGKINPDSDYIRTFISQKELLSKTKKIDAQRYIDHWKNKSTDEALSAFMKGKLSVGLKGKEIDALLLANAQYLESNRIVKAMERFTESEGGLSPYSYYLRQNGKEKTLKAFMGDSKTEFTLADIKRYEQGRQDELSKGSVRDLLHRAKGKAKDLAVEKGKEYLSGSEQNENEEPDMPEEAAETDVVTHYEMIDMISRMQEEGKSYQEIQEKYRKSFSESKYRDWLLDEKNQKITVSDILAYEEGKIQEKGKKHQDRLDLIEKFHDEMTEEENESYRNMVRSQQGVIKMHFSSLVSNFTDIHIGADQNQAVIQEMTPERILSDVDKRILRDEAKHQERLDYLRGRMAKEQEKASRSDADAEEEESVWDGYMRLGGSRGFIHANEDAIREQFSRLNKQEVSYDEILAYEQERRNFYADMYNRRTADESVYNELSLEIAERLQKIAKLKKG